MHWHKRHSPKRKRGERRRTHRSICQETLFSEDFQPSHVIGEHYLKTAQTQRSTHCPPTIHVTNAMLEHFDGTLEKAIALTEALTGTTIADQDKTAEAIGKILSAQQTVQFLEDKLSENSHITSNNTKRVQGTAPTKLFRGRLRQGAKSGTLRRISWNSGNPWQPTTQVCPKNPHVLLTGQNNHNLPNKRWTTP